MDYRPFCRSTCRVHVIPTRASACTLTHVNVYIYDMCACMRVMGTCVCVVDTCLLMRFVLTWVCVALECLCMYAFVYAWVRFIGLLPAMHMSPTVPFVKLLWRTRLSCDFGVPRETRASAWVWRVWFVVFFPSYRSKPRFTRSLSSSDDNNDEDDPGRHFLEVLVTRENPV